MPSKNPNRLRAVYKREYTTWKGMRVRCNSPLDFLYPKYGGRGISVCQAWDTFEQFLQDMGPRPEGKTLDRIDNSGNYEPSNCRWATPLEQANNTRRTRRHVVNGESLTISEIARKFGVSRKTVTRSFAKYSDSAAAISDMIYRRGLSHARRASSAHKKGFLTSDTELIISPKLVRHSVPRWKIHAQETEEAS